MNALIHYLRLSRLFLRHFAKVRVDQYEDRTRFQKEIQKIKQEIRELMH